MLEASPENTPVLLHWSAALRRARRRQRMTQAELARRAGLDRTDISMLERVDVDATFSLWLDVLRVLGIESVVLSETAFNVHQAGDIRQPLKPRVGSPKKTPASAKIDFPALSAAKSGVELAAGCGRPPLRTPQS
jgi:transcriptional regulator with XRE-family HTH domain